MTTTEYQKIDRLVHPGRAKAYQQKYAAKHPERIKKTGAKMYLKNRQIIEQLKDVPCADCKIEYPPYVMDFDPKDPATKTFELGSASTSLIKLLEEALKCDVVCSNCHRIRTHKQRIAQGKTKLRTLAVEKENDPTPSGDNDKGPPLRRNESDKNAAIYHVHDELKCGWAKGQCPYVSCPNSSSYLR